jgi:hypothetical protein
VVASIFRGPYQRGIVDIPRFVKAGGLSLANTSKKKGAYYS